MPRVSLDGPPLSPRCTLARELADVKKEPFDGESAASSSGSSSSSSSSTSSSSEADSDDGSAAPSMDEDILCAAESEPKGEVSEVDT